MTIDRLLFLAGASASLGLLALPTRLLAHSLAPPSSPHPTPVMFGADYYPDQTPETLWLEDAQRMSAMGINSVRIAEFAWQLMEPSEGHYDFAWLHRSVQILHQAGIGVMLGTPSAAPPPWLTQKYPQVFEVNAAGMPLGPEGRRFTCPSNPLYRQLSVKIATEMAKSFASTPGVTGWQIDNELTLGDSARCYCSFCRTGFQQWLQARYATLDKLNALWGTVFWSQTYTDWSQIPVPLPSGGPPNPGMALDYDRYQSHANVQFLELQLQVLRQLCPSHFITTNNVAAVDTIDSVDLYRNLDFVSSDNYPGFFSVYGLAQPGGQVMSPDQVALSTAWTLDMSRGAKQGKPFFIMEQQSGKAGQNFFSPQPQPGQLRLWSFQTIAHGAMGIHYFRWDTARSGAEEYWHGLLTHDRSKSPGFDEIQTTIHELKSLGRDALYAETFANAAILYDYDSLWALGFQPGQPNLKYQAEIVTWYAALQAGGALIDMLPNMLPSGPGTAANTHPDLPDLSRYKVILAPTLYVVSPRQAQRIEAYVRNGGTFIGSYRLGVKDEHSQIVNQPLPGLLAPLMGVTVLDYVPIYPADGAPPITVSFGPTPTPTASGSSPSTTAPSPASAATLSLTGPDATCDIWADILQPATNPAPPSLQVLATYNSGEYSGKPAITCNTVGQGKAIYLAAHLDPASLARVLITLQRAAGITPILPVPRGVELTVRQSGSTQWTYLLNPTPHPQSLTLPTPFTNALTNTPADPTTTLPPYGVLVLKSPRPA
jgi:beta-galactosidase